jgi:hypothetical protein
LRVKGPGNAEPGKRRDDKPGGVKEEPPQSPGFSEAFVEGKIPVFIISQNGITQSGKVPAYLVHPARPRFQLRKGKFPVLL